MGYRIVYGPDSVPGTGKRRSAQLRILTALCFLALAWAVRLFWPAGREILVTLLLPGDPTQAEAAFTMLFENLRQGEPMLDILTVFCREVLHEIV